MGWGSWSPGPGVLFREERKQLAGQKGEYMFPLHPHCSPRLGLTQDPYCAMPERCQNHGNSGLSHLTGTVWKEMMVHYT